MQHYVTLLALKISWFLNCVMSISHTVENYFSRLWVTDISNAIFTPQALMVSRWAGRWRGKVCLGCISETVRCRKLIRGRDIG